MSKSVAFIELKRCGYNPLNYFNISDFNNIRIINSIDLVTIVGNAVADISKSELQEIYKTNYKLRKQKISTFEKINSNSYNKEKNERRIENENDNISSRGRDIDTKHRIEENREEGFRQIWTNEGELSKREQESNLQSNELTGNIAETFRGDRQEGQRDGTTNNRTDSEEREYRRGIETKRPNEVDRIDERNEKSGRGDNSSRTNLQLNLFTNNIENIPKRAEVEDTPAFSDSQEMINIALQAGTGTQNGKYRVYKLYEDTYSPKDRISFLKNEFNSYGTNAINGFDGIWVDFSAGKGLTLSRSDKEEQLQVNWNTIEKSIEELIKQDKYFVNNEKEEYKKWLANDYENEKWMFDRVFHKDIKQEETNIENLDKNYKLKNSDYFHFHTNEEGYYYEIYDQFGFEQDGGVLEYSDNEENETLMSIRKRLADFTDITELADPNLQEVSQEDMDYIISGQKMEDVGNEIKDNIFKNAIEDVTGKNGEEVLNELKEKETELKEGQIIYLEGDRKYRIENIDILEDDITLLDVTMVENVCLPIFRNDKYSRVLELYKKNEKNFENTIDEKQKEEEKDIEQAKKVIKLFQDREKNGKPLNREEYYKSQEKINYHIDNDNLGEGTSKEKFQNNVNAIKTLKKIEQENRLASKEEQEILSKYVGWGGLADAFDETKDNWRKEYLELKSLLDESEYSKARESTLTSFYTPPIVVKSIYQALQNMGFNKGNILEPSCRYR